MASNKPDIGLRRLSRRRLLASATAAAAAVMLGVLRAQAGTPPLLRRNARSLTASEKALFVQAIKGTKEIPSLFDPDVNAYDWYVRLHYAAYYDDAMPAHMASAFGPWHRWFLVLFEQDLQRVVPGMSIPYWDWTVDNTPESYVWADDFMGGEGDPDDRWTVKTGPFRQGEWSLQFIDPVSLDQDGTIFDLQRHFGVYISGGEPTTRLPTADEVAASLALPTYDVSPWDAHSDPTTSFRNSLEGFRWDPDGTKHPSEVHNRVHNWIGGPMSEGASPNDPTFWLHHSFVDSLYAEWQRRHGSEYLPRLGARYHQNLRDPLWGLGEVTPEMMLDHHALGYVYDRELSAGLRRLPEDARRRPEFLCLLGGQGSGPDAAAPSFGAPESQHLHSGYSQ